MSNVEQFDPITFVLTPELLIDTENNPLLNFLKSVVSSGNKEYIYAAYQNIRFSVSGYDSDPRELYEIPEFVLFCRTLLMQFPFFFYFFPKELCKLLVMGALEAKPMGKGRGFVDPEKLEVLTRKCIENALKFGMHVGHSEKEMRE